MNGNTTGIIPTMEIGGNNGNNGWGGSMGEWIIGLVALGMLGNGGLFGGFGGGNGMYEFPWLMNGQQGINNNTNDGFQNLHLSNQIEGVRDGVAGLSNQLCNVGNDITNAINTTAYNGEIAAANRQMASMQQAFNSQTAITGGLNNLSSQFADCCCENRLATCQTQNTIISEAANTRFADANNTRDIIASQTQGIQTILDKLCQLELDGVKAQVEAKNDKIADLQRELSMADLRASQTAQNAFISQGFANEVDALYNRLNNCPVPTTPVYGRTPIFTCNNNGCGCGTNYATTF
jgi:hypothetical protein